MRKPGKRNISWPALGDLEKLPASLAPFTACLQTHSHSPSLHFPPQASKSQAQFIHHPVFLSHLNEGRGQDFNTKRCVGRGTPDGRGKCGVGWSGWVSVVEDHSSLLTEHMYAATTKQYRAWSLYCV